MLDMQAAIKKAEEFLKSVYPGTNDVIVEEMIPPDEESPSRSWHVTLSFYNMRGERNLKEFQVDAATGSVRGMYMRHVR